MKCFYRKGFLEIFALMAFLSLSCAERTQEEIEDSIRTSKSLASVNKLCENLPKLPDFQFVKKTSGGNSIVSSIGFIFNKKSPNEKIINFYDKWSKDEGWIFKDKLSKKKDDKWFKDSLLVMTKGNQEIIMDFSGGYYGNLKIICQERR
jgi:hypothetical protein